MGVDGVHHQVQQPLGLGLELLFAHEKRSLRVKRDAHASQLTIIDHIVAHRAANVNPRRVNNLLTYLQNPAAVLQWHHAKPHIIVRAQRTRGNPFYPNIHYIITQGDHYADYKRPV